MADGATSGRGIDSNTTTKRGSRNYWLRLGRFALLAFVLPVVACSCGFGTLSAFSLTYVPCSGNMRTPADYGSHYQWEEITISASAGGDFDAYLVHGTNGATLIYPPAFRMSRGNRLFEMMPLVDEGYTVITYDSRRCADMGPISLGYEEVSEVGDVLNYLNTRSDIDMDRLGIHGFSSAGATAIMAAANYPELRAVVATGGYDDMNQVIEQDGGDIPVVLDLYKASLRITYQGIIGNPMSTLSPISHIDDIAPRPVFLIYGTEETGIAGAYRQQEAAPTIATLWVIEGAGHGDYFQVKGDEYILRIRKFFDESLLDN